jgi:hypothetical protein
MYMEWLEQVDRNPGKPPIERLAAYVAARSGRLRLKRDPTFSISPGYGWTGWSVLIDTLKKAFGLFGRTKVTALHRYLGQFVCRIPALTDGNMKPTDWVQTQDSFRKVDYEHHNFGRTELYIVDPAYDLATTVFEFQLSTKDEQELISHYIQISGDSTVAERILLWKLVCGVVVMGQAAAALAIETREQARKTWHERSFLARNFLVYQMNRFSASLLPDHTQVQWTRRLIFLDLDGVFDSDVFDFPQATISSLIALTRLQRHGFSVILNTARSVSDVKQYCESYRLHGGIAESGCMFVDAIAQNDVVLIEPDAVEQLNRCREVIQSLPGVFIDPNYRTAVRAFRYDGKRTKGLWTD